MTMNISKKTAKRLGTLFAEAIHNCETPQVRLGVLTAMDAISEELAWNYAENHVMREAFRERLDDLEPPSRAYARSLERKKIYG